MTNGQKGSSHDLKIYEKNFLDEVHLQQQPRK